MAVTEWLAGVQFWIRTAEELSDREDVAVPDDSAGPILECARPSCDEMFGLDPDDDTPTRRLAREHAVDAHE